VGELREQAPADGDHRCGPLIVARPRRCRCRARRLLGHRRKHARVGRAGAPARLPGGCRPHRRTAGEAEVEALARPRHRHRRAPAQVRGKAQVRPPAAAEDQAFHDLGVDARLHRRLRADLGLELRGRLRPAAARARDGPRLPAPPRGHQGLGAAVHPLPGRGGGDEADAQGRGRRGARGAGRPHPRHARLPDPVGALRAHRQRALPGTRLCRLLPQPVQPAAGAPARRRTRDGRADAVDVARRLRDARGRGDLLPEPDHADHPALRRDGDLAALEGAQHRRGQALPRGAPARPSAGRGDLRRAGHRAGGGDGAHLRGAQPEQLL
ncbi:MAG: Membrane metalloprotease, partial [uncultured Solirubrobacterales bacterium]